jgi:SAM-dependent methyltransferase
MNLTASDWKTLRRLRATFLRANPAWRDDYWRSERDLQIYDQTFGQRIRWKWDYVLRELKQRGWTPPRADVLDWGCGSGVAGRAFLEHFGSENFHSLHLADRSPMAMRYALNRARVELPKIPTRLSVTPALPSENTILLLSHVITELSEENLEELGRLARGAATVLWVEPGAYDASRALIGAREKLREKLSVVAPCTHQAACGMLTAGNERHWCHHFAPSPPEVFTDGDWAKFANVAGMDLRSLPLSFLVMDRREPPALPADAMRIIGKPRIYKAHAQVFGCDATGVHDRRMMKRSLRDAFRKLQKGNIEPLQHWECKDDEIVALDANSPK